MNLATTQVILEQIKLTETDLRECDKDRWEHIRGAQMEPCIPEKHREHRGAGNQDQELWVE